MASNAFLSVSESTRIPCFESHGTFVTLALTLFQLDISHSSYAGQAGAKGLSMKKSTPEAGTKTYEQSERKSTLYV